MCREMLRILPQNRHILAEAVDHKADLRILALERDTRSLAAIHTEQAVGVDRRVEIL